MAKQSSLFPSDERLVAGIVHGGQQEFALLYDKYAPMLYGLLYRITESKAAANELLQGVFMEIRQALLSKEINHTQLVRWASDSSRRKAIEYIKNCEKYQQRLIRQGKIPVLADADENEHSTNPLHNTAFLQECSEKERVVLDLIYCTGCSGNEAAQLLQTTSQDIALTLRSAMKKLRNHVQP